MRADLEAPQSRKHSFLWLSVDGRRAAVWNGAPPTRPGEQIRLFSPRFPRTMLSNCLLLMDGGVRSVIFFFPQQFLFEEK